MNRIGPSAAGEDSSAHTRQTFLYFGSLTLFLYLATPVGYLVDIQTSFMLKNQLGATAEQISTFRLITAIPVYLAFAFGLIRDVWNPFGLRDRGFFLIFAPATAIVFIVMAFSPVSYRGLYVGMFLAMLLSRFISAAYQGLMALVGQEKLMSGRLSVLWNIVSSVPYIAGGFASGYISDHLDPKSTFLLVAGFARLHRPVGILEAAFRIQPCLRQAAGQGHESRGGRQAAGETSGHLSGGSHLLSVEFRAWVEHSAAILSDQ